MGLYGHNHILLVSLPAASIYPVPQEKSVQRHNPIHLLRGNFAFPKMQITVRFFPKMESSQGPLAPIILHAQMERTGEHSCIHQHRLLSFQIKKKPTKASQTLSGHPHLYGLWQVQT